MANAILGGYLLDGVVWTQCMNCATSSNTFLCDVLVILGISFLNFERKIIVSMLSPYIFQGNCRRRPAK